MARETRLSASRYVEGGSKVEVRSESGFAVKWSSQGIPSDVYF
jgi:hypothetical protein